MPSSLLTFCCLMIFLLPKVSTPDISQINNLRRKILTAFSSVPCLNVAVDPSSDVSSTPAQIDQIVECAAGSLRSTLDLIAPLKKKNLKPKKHAPWFNSQTRELKKTTQNLECKWRSSKLEEHRTAWLDGLSSYRRMLRRARASYYSELSEENKNNHRFLFSTIVMKRRSLLHIINFLFLIVFFMTLDITSFVIAVRCREKLTFNVTVLLAISVLLLILNSIKTLFASEDAVLAAVTLPKFTLCWLRHDQERRDQAKSRLQVFEQEQQRGTTKPTSQQHTGSASTEDAFFSFSEDEEDIYSLAENEVAVYLKSGENINVRKRWEEFLFPVLKTKDTSVLVCQQHFIPHCLTNLGQYQTGFAVKLHLNADAIPMVYGHVDKPAEKAARCASRAYRKTS
ncbi:uncharacterized protein V6R79_002943 [Siganus canaliculatus]